jgi:hypothetical protein
MRGAAGALGLGLAASLIGIQRQLLLPESYLRLQAFLFTIGASVAALLGLLWPRSLHQSARLFDRRFGLRERISTAVELAAAGWPGAGEMALWQLNDTLRVCQHVNFRAGQRLRVSARDLALAALMILVALAPLKYGREAFDTAVRQAAFKRNVAAETAHIEALQQQIEGAVRLEPERRSDLLQPLQNLETQLARASSVEQALAALAGGENELSSLADSSQIEAGARLREAGERLAQGPDQELAEFGRQLLRGDFQAAAEALDQMELRTATRDEALAQAGELETAAETVESANPQLAESLRSAASALRQGDPARAEASLAEGARSLAEAGQQILQAEVAAQAANEVAAAQERLLQSSQDSLQAAAGPGQGQGNGQVGQGQGNGQVGQGQGNGQVGQGQAIGAEGGESGQAQGQAAGGAGQGDFQSQAASSDEAGSQPISQDNRPGDGGELPYQPVQPPTLLGADGGQLVTLPGSGDPGELILGAASQPIGAGDTQVPFLQVFHQYEAYARRAINNLRPPTYFEALVRDYFSSLAP